ncbi:MAG: phage major capsid domain-containing protein [Candidatus Fonsibacter sp.]
MEYIYYVGDIREYSRQRRPPGLHTLNSEVSSQKGGQNITCQAYTAISQSTTSHVYNVAVPSRETIVSKEVLWT